MYFPPVGVTSGSRTKWSVGLLDDRLVDQTCTGPVDRPPVAVTLTVCGAVASIVSMIVL